MAAGVVKPHDLPEWRDNMELLKDFSIKDIVISEDYKNTTPGSRKMERAEQRYLQTGLLLANIIINDNNVLIDGYITYLLAVRHGLEQVDVYRGYIEIIEAVHRAESNKVFQWRVPLRLYGQVQRNDFVMARTSSGVKRVLVKAVIRQSYPEQGRTLKRICKICKAKSESEERIKS